MTALQDLGTVWVCDDCLIWNVNGDDTGFCEHADIDDCAGTHCQAVREASTLDGEFPPIPGRSIYLTPADEEQEFSRTRCGACGDRDAGRRHLMHAYFFGG